MAFIRSFTDRIEVVYDADDEEPNCMLCENANRCTGGIIRLIDDEHKRDENFRCGSEWGWTNYIRVEVIKRKSNGF